MEDQNLVAIESKGLLLQSENIGRKEEKCLVPDKLAAFYKAVGGNYDCASDQPTPSLFPMCLHFNIPAIGKGRANAFIVPQLSSSKFLIHLSAGYMRA